MIKRIRIFLWKIIVNIYPAYLRKVYGMHIGKGCRIARSAHLDKSINPKGIYIGENSSVLRDAMILSHDDCRNYIADTHIGDNCIIGVRSIILPGLCIGNQVVIGGGAVVAKDIPDNCVVVGNPGVIVREGIEVKNHRIINKGRKVQVEIC